MPIEFIFANYNFLPLSYAKTAILSRKKGCGLAAFFEPSFLVQSGE
jgi:hypothetical protein